MLEIDQQQQELFAGKVRLEPIEHRLAAPFFDTKGMCDRRRNQGRIVEWRE